MTDPWALRCPRCRAWRLPHPETGAMWCPYCDGALWPLPPPPKPDAGQ